MSAFYSSESYISPAHNLRNDDIAMNRISRKQAIWTLAQHTLSSQMLKRRESALKKLEKRNLSPGHDAAAALLRGCGDSACGSVACPVCRHLGNLTLLDMCCDFVDRSEAACCINGRWLHDSDETKGRKNFQGPDLKRELDAVLARAGQPNQIWHGCITVQAFLDSDNEREASHKATFVAVTSCCDGEEELEARLNKAINDEGLKIDLREARTDKAGCETLLSDVLLSDTFNLLNEDFAYRDLNYPDKPEHRTIKATVKHSDIQRALHMHGFAYRSLLLKDSAALFEKLGL